MSSKTINILGATGSIGQSAASVIEANSGAFDVQMISARQNADLLAETAIQLNAKIAVIADEAALPALQGNLAGTDIKALGGQDALNKAAAENVDITLAAIVGMAGLDSLMSAIEGSKAVAIANKEPLVAAGPLVLAAAEKHGTTILPVDSEHNAIFQVFDRKNPNTIERIILTASGGPFRDWALEDMLDVTPQQAVSHPNWSMGAKISVDSATMMNKALEVIEAHYLFNIPADKIDVLIHPQSLIHSMVEYCDGSVLAQMGASDMRTPLANVLGWPDRLQTPGQRLDFTTLKQLSFEEPDTYKFPALLMAYECLKLGNYACIALNASNEVAVEAFLDGQIGFLDIARLIRNVLDELQAQELHTLDDIQNFDRAVRSRARSYIDKKFNGFRRAVSA